MKKRNLAIGIVLLALLGGVIVKGEIAVHQEKIEQQKRKEAREKEERKKLNYKIARYLVQNCKFKKPLKSLKFSKKYHYTEWSDVYAVDFIVNDLSKSLQSIDIPGDTKEKFTYKNTSLLFDGNILFFRKKALNDEETNKLMQEVKISNWDKKHNGE